MYVLLSIGLILVLLKSNMSVKSSVPTYLKAIYVAAFGVCTFMYLGVRTKLTKKLDNKAESLFVSRAYRYVFLTVIAFVLRLVMVLVLNEKVDCALSPGFSVGLGSYINYGLGLFVKNQMYANVIINTILAILGCVIIKRIMLNITQNDIIATGASIMYLFLPQSLVCVTQYVRYNYNVIFVLLGMLVFTKIIDQVSRFDKKSKAYLIYSIIFGIIQSIDIILGGSYILWLCTLPLVTLAAMYIATINIKIKFKLKLKRNLKILASKLERLNISKLICVSAISLIISGITTIVCITKFNVNNYQMWSITNCVNLLMHSRNYYLILIVFSLVFEIIGVILKRKLDIKMFMIKVIFIVSGIHTFFTVGGVYASAVFDVLLVLTVITNICNICYNGEQRIKLLSYKN